MEFLLLAAACFILFILTFRAPGAPRISRLVLFLLLIVASTILAYYFIVKVFGYNPNPTRVRIANLITDNKLIDLQEIAPGVQDLDDIYRVDTDVTNNQEEPDEWLVFYRYDIAGGDTDRPRGPFGAAIYEPDRCRPPAILSYELVPLNYDYLGESAVQVKVKNIIQFKDPSSRDRSGMPLDRPEVIITGRTRQLVTDLSIFRKVGSPLDCSEIEGWRSENPGLACPSTRPVMFLPLGTFRGNQGVALEGSTVTVSDSGGFERSQIIIERVYEHNNTYGDYLRYEGGTLVDPKQLALPKKVGLAFGTGQPDEVQQVYYPEKTVLAFFLDLAEDPDSAYRYTCGQGKGTAEDYVRDYFDLPVPLEELTRVAVCEIRYVPNIAAEQGHQDTDVWVKVEEITGTEDENDCVSPRSLKCVVGSVPNSEALPYGCEWCIRECREEAW